MNPLTPQASGAGSADIVCLAGILLIFLLALSALFTDSKSRERIWITTEIRKKWRRKIVTLHWHDPLAGDAFVPYEIWRENGHRKERIRLPASRLRTYTDETVKPGTTYHYMVCRSKGAIPHLHHRNYQSSNWSEVTID